MFFYSVNKDSDLHDEVFEIVYPDVADFVKERVGLLRGEFRISIVV